MTDLRERVPAHSLIDELLRQWDLGTIHIDEQSNGVIIDDDAEGWYRGVIGERHVARILAELSPEWTVLHSVPVGKSTSDIDHIAIGPPGIFTINTKFSPGRDVWVAGRGMYVGGAKQQYVLNALFEARRASNFLTSASGLTVPVTGVIAFVDPARMTHKAPAGGGEADPPIIVTRASELLRVLNGRPEFSTEQIARIVDAAVRPETWAESPLPSSIGSYITLEFGALEEAVGPRLALPRGEVRTARQASSPRAAATPMPSSRNSQRSPSRPSQRRRRPRRSPLEKFLTDMVMPIVMLTAVWAWASSR